jgi:hypothetical protein
MNFRSIQPPLYVCKSLPTLSELGLGEKTEEQSA